MRLARVLGSELLAGLAGRQGWKLSAGSRGGEACGGGFGVQDTTRTLRGRVTGLMDLEGPEELGELASCCWELLLVEAEPSTRGLRIWGLLSAGLSCSGGEVDLEDVPDRLLGLLEPLWGLGDLDQDLDRDLDLPDLPDLDLAEGPGQVLGAHGRQGRVSVRHTGGAAVASWMRSCTGR